MFVRFPQAIDSGVCGWLIIETRVKGSRHRNCIGDHEWVLTNGFWDAALLVILLFSAGCNLASLAPRCHRIAGDEDGGEPGAA